jgi:hypothetical protein
MGMLGPIDPKIATEFNPVDENGRPVSISVEDVRHFFELATEFAGLKKGTDLTPALLSMADHVKPLALGNVKRSIHQAEMLASKLLKQRSTAPGIKRLTDAQIKKVIAALSSELYSHDHPIGRDEARDVGLSFVEDASPEVERAMWALYERYAADMDVERPWQPLRDLAARLPLPAAPKRQSDIARSGLTRRSATLRAEWTWIESARRSDRRSVQYEVVGVRDYTGEVDGSGNWKADTWTEEIAVPRADSRPSPSPRRGRPRAALKGRASKGRRTGS